MNLKLYGLINRFWADFFSIKGPLLYWNLKCLVIEDMFPWFKPKLIWIGVAEWFAFWNELKCGLWNIEEMQMILLFLSTNKLILLSFKVQIIINSFIYNAPTLRGVGHLDLPLSFCPSTGPKNFNLVTKVEKWGYLVFLAYNCVSLFFIKKERNQIFFF